MQNSLLAFMILFAPVCHAYPLNEPALQILKAWHVSEKSVLVLGESSHGDSSSIDLLKQLIDLEWRNIDFISLESSASEQNNIDDYLFFGSNLPQHISGSSARDASLLTNIFLANQKRAQLGLAPIQVIACDLPGDNFKSKEDWFMARDHHMAQLISSKTNAFQKRGIIFTGAGHAAKNEYKTQQLIKRIMPSIDTLKPLASYDGLKEKSVSIFIQTRFSIIERILLATFKDTRPVLKLARKLSLPPGQLISTKSADFSQAESKAKMTDETPMKISENFDYWINLSLNSPCERSLYSRP